MPRSVLAAAFESLVAAIYLDGGMAPAEQFILAHVDAEIEAAVSSEFGGNFKSLLQQLAQREHGVTPSYQLLDEKVPTTASASRSAPRSVSSASRPVGQSKKESEQRARPQRHRRLRGEPIPFPSDDAAEAGRLAQCANRDQSVS